MSGTTPESTEILSKSYDPKAVEADTYRYWETNRLFKPEVVSIPHGRFSLVIPAAHTASREVQALFKVLTSPWLLAQLASLPGYDAATCGDRLS